MQNEFLKRIPIAGPPYPGLPEITVLSTHRWPNFGDRLGFHLLPRLVPPQVSIGYESGPAAVALPLAQRPRLLILYLGTSLFGQLLSDKLVSFVRSFPYSIGIFGTQYREQLSGKSALFGQLLSQLTIWCARYKEDLEFYDHPINGIHFGDWLIDLFPLTFPGSNQPLTIPAAMRHTEVPLDRTIQEIQWHSHVHSARLHPLLCALTSARSFSYEEQREYSGDDPSGKFRSLFLDIFKKNYPENAPVDVDRDAVIAYKIFVRANVEQLAAAIKVIFRDICSEP